MAEWSGQWIKPGLTNLTDLIFQVYYKIDKDTIADVDNQALIQQSLGYITKKVPCLTFIDLDEAAYTKADHILFAADGGNSGKSGRGCWSFLGRVGDQQTLNLGEQGCFTLATIVHEVLHAMAFVHEQSRPDRDDYIKVNIDKIKPNHTHNFEARPWTEVDMRHTFYDFQSVLHYSYDAFAKIEGDQTLETIHPGDEDSLFAGHDPTDPLSPADVVELSLAYSCPIGSRAMVDYVNSNRRFLSNRMTMRCCQPDEQNQRPGGQGDAGVTPAGRQGIWVILDYRSSSQCRSASYLSTVGLLLPNK